MKDSLAQQPSARQIHDIIAGHLERNGLTHSCIKQASEDVLKLFAPSTSAAIEAVRAAYTKEAALRDVEIAQLHEELAEWKQAASVEAGLRREAFAQVESMRACLEPFNAMASVKGGTDGAKELRAVICAIMEHTSYPDDLKAIEQFCNAILRARDVMRSLVASSEADK